LHVDQADTLVAEAEDSLERAKAEVQSALKNIASLLSQPALRSLLEQGKQEQFIAEVLAASSDEKLADILAELDSCPFRRRFSGLAARRLAAHAAGAKAASKMVRNARGRFSKTSV